MFWEDFALTENGVPKRGFSAFTARITSDDLVEPGASETLRDIYRILRDKGVTLFTVEHCLHDDNENPDNDEVTYSVTICKENYQVVLKKDGNWVIYTGQDYTQEYTTARFPDRLLTPYQLANVLGI